MMAGLYILIARYNLVKKMIGLGVFQTSIFYLYITIGKVGRRHRADPDRGTPRTRSTRTRCRTC